MRARRAFGAARVDARHTATDRPTGRDSTVSSRVVRARVASFAVASRASERAVASTSNPSSRARSLSLSLTTDDGRPAGHGDDDRGERDRGVDDREHGEQRRGA